MRCAFYDAHRKCGEGGMGRLTTHILDTSHGTPASSVEIRLYSIGAERKSVAFARTNADGRTAKPLLEGGAMLSGQYELEFDIGDYFRAKGVSLGEPAFLETVVIRFSVSADEHYHVPLLVSPWSYSTYRGS
jgi:5-hydroxyisourate hydrolase